MPLLLRAPLQTPNITVRDVQPVDLPDLLQVNGDPEVTRFLPYPPWASLIDARVWLERMQTLVACGHTLQMVIEDRLQNRVIGSCLLFRYDERNRSAELGYVLGRAHWGQGRMREALTLLISHAFNQIGLRRLEACIAPDNHASEALLLRLGFTREGQMRRNWLSRAPAYDTKLFGLLSDEWPLALA